MAGRVPGRGAGIDPLRDVFINDTLWVDEMKEIVETDECLEFRAELNADEFAEYRQIRRTLHDDGRLEYPFPSLPLR